MERCAKLWSCFPPWSLPPTCGPGKDGQGSRRVRRGQGRHGPPRRQRRVKRAAPRCHPGCGRRAAFGPVRHCRRGGRPRRQRPARESVARYELDGTATNCASVPIEGPYFFRRTVVTGRVTTRTRAVFGRDREVEQWWRSLRHRSVQSRTWFLAVVDDDAAVDLAAFHLAEHVIDAVESRAGHRRVD